MTELNWQQVPGGELAHGTDWTYLITQDDRHVVLTRWEPPRDQPGEEPAWPPRGTETARQAALYAIQVGGAYNEAPEAAAATVARLKQAARQYEAGLDVTGQPSWWHGYVPG